ncbi:bifunctional acetate--CoA ligase family protein/GNAT family N-acetyltransferase [Dongia rigui]|uniref:Bifunctional acetate--CoA ligase family protein/GNAT family N-acetyltransferase n=1 Tax=Dongia rigui TaxID=940149 RepID=A0ABU5DUG3_9PROT|nr:bifunctional acetate--CoA ligase family protein/GNAT family N-acetyltransferase [Dongia rigui]MDY0870974.1 bifunctional acetate--CoA ligase family protein/GNAT family N-acetyltransferase [Dongia rigui]
MTIRNLDKLFRPQSLAIIGASDRAGAIGHVLARNALAEGFRGPVHFVNPKYPSVLTRPCVATIDALETAPDLAVIATPAATVPGIIRQLAARGTRGAIIISAGFGGEAGQALKREMQLAARPHLMRLVGPNCLGVIAPTIGLNVSFAHLSPKKGSIALLTQSGAILTSALDWAAARGIGFSHLVSMGEMLDVDLGDMLDYLASDGGTSAILIYAEAVTNARKFVSAARRAARLKPVIIIKAGRFGETASAVASHTGALAGSDAVYDAVFRRVGLLRVDDLAELFEAMETLALMGPAPGDRLTILTNGGGAGILAADALVRAGGRLAPLDATVLGRLDAVLPKGWSRGNPVDIIGDADPERYRVAMDILADDPHCDALLVLNSPTALTSSDEAADAVIAGLAGRKKPVLTSWIGDQTSRPARAKFAAAKIPSYTTPEQAIRAFGHMVAYRHSQMLLTETPPSLPGNFTPDRDIVRRMIDQALTKGRSFLTSPESLAVMNAYGINVVTDEIVATPQEARQQAEMMSGPLVLKLLSPDITHKSDIGGVVLGLTDGAAVEAAASAMLERVTILRPDARIEGFTLSPMIDRSASQELILGAVTDAQFGPVILFGQGGTSVEVTADRALALPPLNLKLARELIADTRVYRLLRGYRDRPAADLDGIALALVRVAQLMMDFAEIQELDINPLLANEHTVIALDARVRVVKNDAAPQRRLAIRPYPQELEEVIPDPDGGLLLLRPIRPEDEPGMIEAFEHLSSESVELRFFRVVTNPSHQMIAGLTQIDYDREMALVLTDADTPAGAVPPIYADVRLLMDPDRVEAEYAIIVRDDMAGRGFGSLMMERIIAYGRSINLARITGLVRMENASMLAICQRLGFTRRIDPDMPGLFHVTKELGGTGS